MKINLAELAGKVQEHYKDVECSFGEIRVYHTPEPVVWLLKPDWSLSPIPQKEMELATGQKQTRSARTDSPEYLTWEVEKEKWEKEQVDIQFAARYVMALRDVEYPEDLSSPPSFLSNYLNGYYPINEILRKKTWLDATVLARTPDLLAIQAAIMELNGAEMVKDDDVDNVKKSSESDSGESGLIKSELKEVEKIQ